MPWSPRWRMRRDARLDPYRDRIALLTSDGQIVGHVLVLTEHFSTYVGGHLWWRRWNSDREGARPQIAMLDGRFYDVPIDDGELDHELSHWSREELPLLGELFQMHWLTSDEALCLAPSVFGVSGCVGIDGDISWNSGDEP